MRAGIEQNVLDYVGISLSVTSDRLSPDEISTIIGIQPTSTRQRGALTRTGLMRRPEFDLHEWEFREQLDLNPRDYIGCHSATFITEFLDKIKDAAPQVKELSENHDVLISLVYHTREIPYIGLSREQVLAIAELGARLDYDFTVEECSSGHTEEHEVQSKVDKPNLSC
jgi:hypothetical protein